LIIPMIIQTISLDPSGPTRQATSLASPSTAPPGRNGHRHPAALASALPQDRTTAADPDPAAAPDVRSQVRALVARERAGGPTATAAEVIAMTGRSRRRAYELLRDARAEG
jgi:hypothetical protein